MLNHQEPSPESMARASKAPSAPAPVVDPALAKLPALRKAPPLPPVHVEFRLAEPASKYVPNMSGVVRAIEFFLAPEHLSALKTEKAGVEFGSTGVKITPNAGAVCHRVSPTQVRVASIYETTDETLLYALFALTNGKPIFLDGGNAWLRPLNIEMKAMSTGGALILSSQVIKPILQAVPLEHEATNQVRRAVERAREISFPDRLARASRLVGELSIIMESLAGYPGIDAQVVADKRGQSPRIRLRRT